MFVSVFMSVEIAKLVIISETGKDDKLLITGQLIFSCMKS